MLFSFKYLYLSSRRKFSLRPKWDVRSAREKRVRELIKSFKFAPCKTVVVHSGVGGLLLRKAAVGLILYCKLGSIQRYLKFSNPPSLFYLHWVNLTLATFSLRHRSNPVLVLLPSLVLFSFRHGCLKYLQFAWVGALALSFTGRSPTAFLTRARLPGWCGLICPSGITWNMKQKPRILSHSHTDRPPPCLSFYF